MGLAILEQKNLASAWSQKQIGPRKIQKGSMSAGRKSKQEKSDSGIGMFLKNLVTGIAKVILIAACSYGIFASHRFITSSLYFNINKVNWFGHQSLTTDNLASWVGPIIGENIFKLNLDGVAQRLTEHPWIKTASVKRVFPQDLHIDLKERIPFARVQLDQVYIMDNYGILLGPEEKKLNGLPLITGFSSKNTKLGSNVASEDLIEGLTAMHYINLLPMFKKNPIDTVHISNGSKVTFITHSRNMKIYMRSEVVKENLKNLALILETIEEDERNLSYIDLSFKNKIVVKHDENIK